MTSSLVKILVAAMLAGGAGIAIAEDADPRGIFGVYMSGRAETPCGRSASFGRKEGCPVNDVGIAAKNSVNNTLDDPQVNCEPGRLVRLFTWFPRQTAILQGDNEIVFHYEHFSVIRTIHMNDQPAPPDSWKSIHGFSRGHWEGDTLVVETTNLLENHFVIPTSDETRTIERYRWNEDRSRLLLDVEIFDSKYYDAPFSLRQGRWTPDPDGYIAPFVCETITDDVFFGDMDSIFEDSGEED